MTNYTPAQLEAWAGLGPWCALGSDPAEGVDCFWIMSQPNPAMRGFSDEIASVNGSQNDPKRQTNATIIAAAPDLARLVLERDAEIARLKAAAEDLVGLCHADVKMNSTTYQPMPNRSAFTKAVERMIELINKDRQVMKGGEQS